MNEVGASTHLALVFQPRTVSFSNINFIERSLDKPEDLPEGLAPHMPNPNPQRIDEYNGHMSDLIGVYPPKEHRENSILLFQNLPLPLFYFGVAGFTLLSMGKIVV